MIDRFGRKIEYLRLSVIDQCNLNCMYCLPDQHSSCNMMTRDEIIRIVEALADLGIRKVRLTGGEPLMRRDLEDIVRGISAIPGITDIPMTTNGVGLAGRLDDLMAAGLTRLNISLDSMQSERYTEITGRNKLSEVMQAVEKALRLQIDTKINVVVMRDVNGSEIDDFINLAKQNKLEVRFIELMPIGKYGEKHRDQMISGQEIIAGHPDLKPLGPSDSGVADLYSGEGFLGKVGFITPISHGFCDSCNRIRVTSDGRMKLCLGQNNEINLMAVLRDQPDQLENILQKSIFNKPKGHEFSQPYRSSRSMGQIGG